MDEHVSLIASPQSWIEGEALRQLNETARLPGMVRAVGMPDLHPGKGHPIGAAFVSQGIIYPYLVGSDIGCGMGLWQTDLAVRKLKLDRAVKKLVGLDQEWDGDAGDRLGDGMSAQALGTIGSGNHFAELQRVHEVTDEVAFAALGLDAAQALLLVHSGSRGWGGAILADHIHRFKSGGLSAGTDAFDAYLTEHDRAVQWAVLNREIIAERFLDCLGGQGTRVLDICHNSVTPYGQDWLHRKGAAPSGTGPIVIPGSRGTATYLVQPIGNQAGNVHSLAHGAGRKWKRSEAKGKLAKRYRPDDLKQTVLGGRVICEDKALLYEEAPEAYKNIEQVIADMADAGLVKVIAILRPVITYKTRRS